MVTHLPLPYLRVGGIVEGFHGSQRHLYTGQSVDELLYGETGQATGESGSCPYSV